MYASLCASYYTACVSFSLCALFIGAIRRFVLCLSFLLLPNDLKVKGTKYLQH